MGAYTCQYGVVHKICRCPEPHSIRCDVPEKHKPKDDTATQSGHWVFKDSSIHRCVKPEYDKSVSRGDRWQCGVCDAVWMVESIGSDQRDGSTWIIWKNYN